MQEESQSKNAINVEEHFFSFHDEFILQIIEISVRLSSMQKIANKKHLLNKLWLFIGY